MKDIQGINRGKCNCCECDEYRQPPREDSSDVQYLKLRCEYCNHTPVEHVRLIELGGCTKCGEDNCDKYESDETNCYTACGYCGCPAACHSGAEKLKKKRASDDVFSGLNTSSGIEIRRDMSGKPVQSALYGTCKKPGCIYPVRVDEGIIHEYCSRTCSEQATDPSQGPPSFSAGPVMCSRCRRVPTSPGHSWCKQCYILAESEKNKKMKQ